MQLAAFTLLTAVSVVIYVRLGTSNECIRAEPRARLARSSARAFIFELEFGKIKVKLSASKACG